MHDVLLESWENSGTINSDTVYTVMTNYYPFDIYVEIYGVATAHTQYDGQTATADFDPASSDYIHVYWANVY